MATALEYEGKIMASAPDLCGLCDDHVAVKHCDVCHVDLCVTCTKAHQKLPATKDHHLADMIRDNADSEHTIQTGACTRHGDKLFTIICKDCVELGCDSCKTDHGGHSTQSLDNDPKLCHRVVSKNIQHLLDDVHELEEIKSVLEGHICAYDDALVRVDQWEVDLIKLVTEKAAKIRKQLTDLKDKKSNQLSDQVNGLIVKLKEVDQTFAQLTAVRKSMDFTAITNELAKSQSLIQELEYIHKGLQPSPSPMNVDKVLPNGDRIIDVSDAVDLMFTVGEKQPLPVAEWCFAVSGKGKDVSLHGNNHVTMTGVTYGPGPNGEAQGAVVIPRSRTESIIVTNPDKKLRFSGEMTFFVNVFHESNGDSGYLFVYDTGVSFAGNRGSRVYISNFTSLYIDSGSSFNTPAILTPNSWNKITIVFRAATVSVYVNGVLAHTENKTFNLADTHKGCLHFGRRPGYGGFNGRIASCSFFDVALNENEIKNL